MFGVFSTHVMMRNMLGMGRYLRLMRLFSSRTFILLITFVTLIHASSFEQRFASMTEATPLERVSAGAGASGSARPKFSHSLDPKITEWKEHNLQVELFVPKTVELVPGEKPREKNYIRMEHFSESQKKLVEEVLAMKYRSWSFINQGSCRWTLLIEVVSQGTEEQMWISKSGSRNGLGLRIFEEREYLDTYLTHKQQKEKWAKFDIERMIKIDEKSNRKHTCMNDLLNDKQFWNCKYGRIATKKCGMFCLKKKENCKLSYIHHRDVDKNGY